MSWTDTLVNRRRLLAAAVAAGTVAAVPPRPAGATASLPAGATAPPATGRRDAPVCARYRVGGLEVLALTDAAGAFFLAPGAAFPGADPEDWALARAIDPDAFGPEGAWLLEFRCYAIRRPDGRYTLVDTGIGPADSPAAAWAPVPGRLPDALAESGIDVADVDTVVLTHLHEDHAGGSVTSGGAPVFPNARYVVQRAELDALGDSAMVRYAVDPLRAAGQLHVVDGPAVLSRHRWSGPGVTGTPGSGSGVGDAGATRAHGRATADRLRVVPTPGHTPGHQSVLIEGRDRQVVVTGDVLVHAVQLADPDVAYRYEADQEQARQTRRALLEHARRNRALLATAHLRRAFVPV